MVFLVVVVSTIPVLAGSTTFLPLGLGAAFTYAEIPFEVGGAGISVKKTSFDFVPTASIDLCGWTADKIHILETAAWAVNVPDGVVVGHINVYYADGSSETLDLIMGVNIAEWAYDRPENQPFLQHTKIPPAYSWWTNIDSDYWYWGHDFYVSIDTARKPLEYLELVLDPNSYTDEDESWFGIDIHAITLQGIVMVDAGSYQSITWPADTVSLDGTITAPEGVAVTTTWSKISGPGTVTFGNIGAVDTTAMFSEAGVYVLRLTANDGIQSVYDEVQVRVREEGTTDIDVNNFSFEYFEDGSQILCHMVAGHPEWGPDLMGWSISGDWIGVDVECGAPGACSDDCRPPAAPDGIAYSYIQSNDIYFYQVLEHKIIEGSKYTLTFDAIAPWSTGVKIVPSLFYVDESNNHIELAARVISLGLGQLCYAPSQWADGLTVTFVSQPGATYIGKPLGVKFFAPIPADLDTSKWTLIDTVRVDMAVVTAVQVVIDIKPGSYPNAINLGSYGLIPVAIFSDMDFDATTIDPDTVELAGADVAMRGKSNKFMAHAEDVDADGLLDLVVQVATENLDPGAFQDGWAVLTGKTFNGQNITGQDEITIVPPE